MAAFGGFGGFRQFEHFHGMHFAGIGKEHEMRVAIGGKHLFDIVAFLGADARHAPAAPSLRRIFLAVEAFDIALMGQGDDRHLDP